MLRYFVTNVLVIFVSKKTSTHLLCLYVLYISSSLFFHFSTFQQIKNTYHYFLLNLIQIRLLSHNKVQFCCFSIHG